MPASLLVVRLSALGDVVHALPALELVRAALPASRLGWAVEAEGAPLLERHPALDRLHVLPRRALARPSGRVSALRQAGTALRELAGERYDWALDLQGLARSALVARLGARRVLGPASARELAPLLYARRLAVPAPGEAHAVERSLALARAALAVLGVSAPRVAPAARLVLPRGALEEAGALVPPGDGLEVVLLPGAGKPANRPPVSLLVAVARRLRQAEPGVRLLVVGGAGDRTAGRELALRARARDATGRLGLGASAALLGRASAVLGGDTGPLHVARALGTPVVSLFFAADPARTGPGGFPGRAPALVLRGGAPCAPCLGRTCRRPAGVRTCLDPLDPARIAAAVLEAARTPRGR